MQVQQVFSNENLVLHFWGNLIIFNFHRLIFGLFKKVIYSVHTIPKYYFWSEN